MKRMFIKNNDQTVHLNKWSQSMLQWLYNEIVQLMPYQPNTNNLSHQHLLSQPKNIININKSMQSLIEILFDSSRRLLGRFLLRVNFEYFSKTEIVYSSRLGDDNDGLQFIMRLLGVLQNYINYTEKKRLRRKYVSLIKQEKYKQNINNTNTNNTTNKQQPLPLPQSFLIQLTEQTIIPILLFMCTRAQHNQQFISRIITLSIQQQYILKEVIQWVNQELLQQVSQKQQLIVRFNQLEQDSDMLTQQFVSVKQGNDRLKERLQLSKLNKSVLQQQQSCNQQQKLSLLQQLYYHHHSTLTRATTTTTSYTEIFNKLITRNSLLQLLLKQRQKQHQQLLSKNNQIVQQLQSFEQVLGELQKERKQIKRVVNQKENYSFMLEMRVSLKQSNQGNNYGLCNNSVLRGSINNKNMNNEYMNNNNVNYNSLLHSTVANPNVCLRNQQVHQSMNMISKMQQLKQQKYALIKERDELKIIKGKLINKNNRQQRVLGELRQAYEGFMEEFITNGNNGNENNSRSDSNTNIGDSNDIDSSNRNKQDENILRDVSNSIKREVSNIFKRDHIRNNKRNINRRQLTL